MIGSVLDKYEVLQKLGEGATATVYRGRHLTIGRDVAIKVLHPHLSASSRYRERFNREARAVGRLSHQNIVSILDYSGQTAEECFIVTELVDGVTLQQLIQERGRLPSEIAAIVGADLASALAFAHREGIIHRDIKPENVMIRRDGRVKLMDFGVARVLDESSITLDGSLLGSPAYMSPQQALDESLDGRSDLFSLGTVLFHAVTGHVPFSGSNASVILRNIIEANRPEVLELAPQASPAIAAVIDRLLQPRPEDRYPTADDASAALLACLEEMRLSPEHPTVNLRAYVVDPEACEEHLTTLLRSTLLDVGKARLSGGDTLGALQLFNRLLAVDEDNAEVISLIQSLHQAPAPPVSARARLLVPALAVALVASLVGGGWFLWGGDEPPPVRAHLPAPDGLPGTALAATAMPAPDSSTAPATSDATEPPAVAAVNVAAPPSRPSEPAPAPAEAPRAVAGTALPARPPEGTRVTARVEPPPLKAPAPGYVVLTLTGKTAYADVWVDGKRVGSRAGGNPDNWVGTADHPLQVEPGERWIEVKNDYAEDWKTKIVISAGETKPLFVDLVQKKANFTVHWDIPDACAYTVGDTYYESTKVHRVFALRDPAPSTPVVFDCPEPIGRFTTVLGKTVPGNTYFIPTPAELEKLKPRRPTP